jgi:hypothetical protein
MMNINFFCLFVCLVQRVYNKLFYLTQRYTYCIDRYEYFVVVFYFEIKEVCVVEISIFILFSIFEIYIYFLFDYRVFLFQV